VLSMFVGCKLCLLRIEELNRYAVVFASLPLSDQDKLSLHFIQSGFCSILLIDSNLNTVSCAIPSA
jgi:hypothetical protein